MLYINAILIFLKSHTKIDIVIPVYASKLCFSWKNFLSILKKIWPLKLICNSDVHYGTCDTVPHPSFDWCSLWLFLTTSFNPFIGIIKLSLTTTNVTNYHFWPFEVSDVASSHLVCEWMTPIVITYHFRPLHVSDVPCGHYWTPCFPAEHSVK